MRRYRLTMMVPHETVLSAEDLKSAGEEAARILKNYLSNDGSIEPFVHSIYYVDAIPNQPEDFFSDDKPPPRAA